MAGIIEDSVVEVVQMDLSKLNFAPYNPRIMTDDQMESLKTSIKKNGVVSPIVWNKKTGYIVGGNQRLAALIDMGIKKTWVVVIDVSPEREKALNVALNKISGDWDYSKLKTVFKDIDMADWDMTGFQAAEITVLNSDEMDFDLADFREEAKAIEAKAEDARNYVIYLTFNDKHEADRWLEENGFEERFKPSSKTVVIEMT